MNTLYAGPPVVAYYAAQVVDWQPYPVESAFTCTMLLTEERMRVIIREELERMLAKPKRKRAKRK